MSTLLFFATNAAPEPRPRGCIPRPDGGQDTLEPAPGSSDVCWRGRRRSGLKGRHRAGGGRRSMANHCDGAIRPRIFAFRRCRPRRYLPGSQRREVRTRHECSGWIQIAATKRCLPFECVALVLQGGGALGAYQGGVYEALAEANIHPDWIAGISIGAINGAIIAGNAPDDRVDRLREFWTHVTSIAPWHWSSEPFQDLARSDDARAMSSIK